MRSVSSSLSILYVPHRPQPRLIGLLWCSEKASMLSTSELSGQLSPLQRNNMTVKCPSESLSYWHVCDRPPRRSSVSTCRPRGKSATVCFSATMRVVYVTKCSVKITAAVCICLYMCSHVLVNNRRRAQSVRETGFVNAVRTGCEQSAAFDRMRRKHQGLLLLQWLCTRMQPRRCVACLSAHTASTWVGTAYLIIVIHNVIQPRWLS